MLAILVKNTSSMAHSTISREVPRDTTGQTTTAEDNVHRDHASTATKGLTAATTAEASALRDLARRKATDSVRRDSVAMKTDSSDHPTTTTVSKGQEALATKMRKDQVSTHAATQPTCMDSDPTLKAKKTLRADISREAVTSREADISREADTSREMADISREMADTSREMADTSREADISRGAVTSREAVTSRGDHSREAATTSSAKATIPTLNIA